MTAKDINAILDDPQSVKNDISTFAGRMLEFSKLFNKHQNWNHTSSKVLDKLLSGILEHTRDFVRYHYDLNERKQDYWNQQVPAKTLQSDLEFQHQKE
mgnify:CR=1 FL=1